MQSNLPTVEELLRKRYTLKKGLLTSFLSVNECHIKKNLWDRQKFNILDTRDQRWVQPFFSELDGKLTLSEMLTKHVPKERQQEVIKLVLHLEGRFIEESLPIIEDKEEELSQSYLNNKTWFEHMYTQKVRDSHLLLQHVKNAHVVILGAGILGSRLAMSLVQMNVGRLSILDDCTISQHDRNNSPIYTTGADHTPRAKQLADYSQLIARYSTIRGLHLKQDEWLDWIRDQIDSIALIIVGIDEFAPSIYYNVNKFAVRYSIPWSFVATEGWNAYIGPTFFPKQTGCFTCYIHDKSEQDKDFGRFFRETTRMAEVYHPPVSPNMAQFVAGMYSMNIPNILHVKEREVYPELTISRQLKIDLLYHRYTYEYVQKYPRCSTCGVKMN